MDGGSWRAHVTAAIGIALPVAVSLIPVGLAPA